MLHFFPNNFLSPRALVRLASFQSSGYKMLLHGGETPNVEKPSPPSTPGHKYDGFQDPRMFNGGASMPNGYGGNPWNRQGTALSALSRFGANARGTSDPAWLSRIHHQHAIVNPPSI